MKTMKMAAFSGITLLLLLCCSVISSTESRTDCDSPAARGEAFTVPVGHPLKDTDRVKWKHGSDTIVDRKTIGNGKGYKFVTGSKDDIFSNGSLNLRNVTKANEGVYTPTVFSAEGVGVQNIKSVRLCVFDRAPKPTLKFDCLTAEVKLTCDVGKVKDLKFVWLQDNKELTSQKSQVWKLKLKDVGDHSFSCKVSNGLGSNTSGSVKGLCNASFFSFFPTDFWGITWICVGGGGGLVLLLIIIVIVCCVRAKRKKRIQKKDEEELRLRWADPEQQQQHQCPQHGHPASRHHQHQDQPQDQHQDQPQDQHQHQHQHQDQHQHQQPQQQPAGHTGPRQHRSKQHRPRAPEPPAGHPQPSPRRPAQTSRADVNGDDEKPPPLPQPRSKTPRTRV
ncbi:T-cell surface antigen CD2 [Hippoglossus stenolepis]|uniref:T-cell surface antigen CD2 n=1 Tax=Hippoglossus stenolepis TaxID=195615 RepID=UPI001FAF8C7B|nr:T-cell surface antigen CD2 [Hippoglossus stenolepis]XP_035005965.2 T-cell surface antigen CD2 [Hippoglossus stenolepis]XP_035005966.2 T-cell surface antigen CD2 [Hippoglossus stenolepis]XP_035005967.2 T-cell surface antigen CD2 [Hippoglossus stenolepis]